MRRPTLIRPGYVGWQLPSCHLPGDHQVSVLLSVCLTVHPTVCLSSLLSVSVCLYYCLSVRLYYCLSVRYDAVHLWMCFIMSTLRKKKRLKSVTYYFLAQMLLEMEQFELCCWIVNHERRWYFRGRSFYSTLALGSRLSALSIKSKINMFFFLFGLLQLKKERHLQY